MICDCWDISHRLCHRRLLFVLTNEGATTDATNQDECDHDTYVVCSEVEYEPSCQHSSGTHAQNDCKNSDPKTDHSNVHERIRLVAVRRLAEDG